MHYVSVYKIVMHVVSHSETLQNICFYKYNYRSCSRWSISRLIPERLKHQFSDSSDTNRDVELNIYKLIFSGLYSLSSYWKETIFERSIAVNECYTYIIKSWNQPHACMSGVCTLSKTSVFARSVQVFLVFFSPNCMMLYYYREL
jgi:hypothetical protein